MKLLTFKELRKQAKGTLFCYYDPDICGTLYFYEGNRGHSDIWKTHISESAGEDIEREGADRMIALEKGGSVGVDFISASAGMPDEDQMFLVWERSDIALFIEKLKAVRFD